MQSEILENNLVLGEKQRTFHLLQETDLLRRQMELDIYSQENFDSSKIENIINIRNILFCNLMEEGLDFEYVSTGDYNHDSFRMVIENIEYICPVIDAKRILKDNFAKYCDNDAFEKIVDNRPQAQQQAPADVTSSNNTQIAELEARIAALTKDVNSRPAATDNSEIIDKLEAKIKLMSEELLSQKQSVKKELETISTKQQDLASKQSKLAQAQQNFADDILKEQTNIKEQQNNIALAQTNLKEQQDNIALAQTNLETSISDTQAKILDQEDILAKTKEYTDKMISTIEIPAAPVQTVAESAAEAVKAINKKEDVEKNHYITDDNDSTRYESEKNISTFLFDKHTVEVVNPAGGHYSTLDVIIAPLKIAENDNHTPIVARIANNRDSIVLMSGKNSAIQAEFDGIHFLVRGMFTNGDFKSLIICSGDSYNLGFTLKTNTTYYRPIMNCYSGHVYFNHKGVDFHIIPFMFENNNKGVTSYIIVCNKDGKTSCFESSLSATTNVTVDGEVYEILCYWRDKVLSCEVLL